MINAPLNSATPNIGSNYSTYIYAVGNIPRHNQNVLRKESRNTGIT